MIVEARIINQPYVDQFEEKIYDISSSWRSSEWTWVKFTNEDYFEWCGEFRGSPKSVAISHKYRIVLVLTSDCLFAVDCSSGELVSFEDQPQYINLTVSPKGDFFVSDYYNIEIIGPTLKEKIKLESPIKMDMIEFSGWSENRLLVSCDEFMNWSNHLKLEMEVDYDSGRLIIKNVI